jgi:2-oxoisovalerate dehydrogenase E1 component
MALLNRKVVTQIELEEIHARVKRSVDEAAEWAEAQPDCDPATALLHTFNNPEPWKGVTEGSASGPEIFMVDALNHALDEELARNPDMCVFGEDVAHGKGGVFTVTAGLTAKYGVSRVFNSQLAESSIAGVAIGLATRGMKPVPEIQFGDYVWTAMNQIRNELALLHYRCGGDFSSPAVIRIPVGGYIHGGAYHSQNIEATFGHFPGLFVVYPSNATDAKGLLKAAIRCQDPVLFLEHKGLYRQVYAKGPEGDADCIVPIGRAKTVRKGSDATIVTWGALVQKSMLAAQQLEAEGWSVEVIDLRSIVPLDMEHVAASVRKTNRVLIAHEDLEFAGFGAEIAAQIADACFQWLDAPVKRVGMKYVAAVPHSPALETVVLPQTEDVSRALEALLAF